MSCKATQDGRVMVKSSDKMQFSGERNGEPLQPSCLENSMNSMKRQKYRTLRDELPRSVGAQYATGEESENSSRRDGAEAKTTSSCGCDWYGNKVQCCKEQYCIGTWNVRSMNQGKLEVIK